MIVIQSLNGDDIQVNENAVLLIAGPYPHDVGPHTYVYGSTHGTLISAEPPDALVARLGTQPPLARLTRPDLSPVWVKGSAVTSMRAPVPTEQEGPGTVNAVLQIGSLHQAIYEDIETVRNLVNAQGGSI